MNTVAVQMTDNTVSSSWWKELVRHFVRAGDELSRDDEVFYVQRQK